MTGRTRLHLSLADPLAAGQMIDPGPERTHFLLHVLRLGPGAEIAVFNERDGEFIAELASSGKKSLRLIVTRRIRPPQPEPGPWLAFAPIKRIDVIAEKATELGATRLVPVITRHTSVSRINLERLAANVTEAAEQCERLSLPEILPPRPLAHLFDDWPTERTLYAALERGDHPPLLRAIRPGPAALLIGPEGGFAPVELELLTQPPFVVPVSLGPRILRAETAALASLALIQAVGTDGPTR